VLQRVLSGTARKVDAQDPRAVAVVGAAH
jgi:hypothetical protein